MKYAMKKTFKNKLEDLFINGCVVGLYLCLLGFLLFFIHVFLEWAL